MVSPRIVILRGKPTSGKSTAFCNLREDERMKQFIFIDHASIKRMFEGLEDEKRKELGKKVLFFCLKQVFPLRKDILIEEMSEETLMKYLGKEIKKYGYRIIIFQFEVSFENAKKRNIQRAKDKWHKLISDKELEELTERHKNTFDRSAILVDTNKLNKQEVIDFIVNRLR